MGVKPDILRSAYRSALDQSLAHGLKSIALCSISTGIFGYDIRKATPVAMAAVRQTPKALEFCGELLQSDPSFTVVALQNPYLRR